MKLDARVPPGPLEQKWARHLATIRLVAPTNKRRYQIIVVGTGLAGASAASTLAELGYGVKAFCFHDSPAAPIRAPPQGALTAAKNYQNDGDSVWRLFHDTVKGAISARARRTCIAWRR